MNVEKTAAYYILGTAALGALGALLLMFLSSPNTMIFAFAGICALFFGYYYWDYWR